MTTTQIPARRTGRRAAVLRTAALALALAAALGACGRSTPPPSASGGPATAGPATGGSEPSVTGPQASAGAAPATRAVSLLTGELTIRASASDRAAVVARLAPATALGAPRVLLVDAAAKTVPGWVPVLLPVRPNGSTGWVQASQVKLEPVGERIVVDLATRRLNLLVDGRTVLDVPVAVGAGSTPTPTGRFYVTDRVRPPDPHGAYGSFALGLSAHSDTLQSFGDGDAQIGVHGTDEPASIGRAVTHGCLRLSDSDAAKLSSVPLGTPVTIA
ncbi:MAG TPA: L,D-transpeptidase [Kineosporiaceae bacterium]|nr:L,D-transpeptidase [Kineosporiaceae bacterium]